MSQVDLSKKIKNEEKKKEKRKRLTRNARGRVGGRGREWERGKGGKGERGKGGKGENLLRRKYIDMLPCVRFEILLLSSEHLNIELNIVQEHLTSSFPLFIPSSLSSIC